MVPPEEIELNAPTTLPADFGEWDSSEDGSAQHSNPGGFDGFPGSVTAPRPVAKSAASARVAVLPVAPRPPAPTPAPRRAAPVYEEAETVYQQPQYQTVHPVSQKYAAEVEEKPKKTGLYVAVAAVVLLAGAGVVAYPHLHSGAAAPKTVAPQQSTMTSAMTMDGGQKPSAASAPVSTTAPAQTPETTAAENTPRPNSDMMNRQLNAPSRITGDLKMAAGNAAEPTGGFGDAGISGLGGNNAVFGGQSGPKVKVASPQKVSISAGAAGALLVQRTNPTYPAIAREAHTQGTVVIQATISRSGVIENPHVVSGPVMLRQSALDAVKNWRYKPYMLDGGPVEVDTTVNVNFTLGQ